MKSTIFTLLLLTGVVCRLSWAHAGPHTEGMWTDEQISTLATWYGMKQNQLMYSSNIPSGYTVFRYNDLGIFQVAAPYWLYSITTYPSEEICAALLWKDSEHMRNQSEPVRILDLPPLPLGQIYDICPKISQCPEEKKGVGSLLSFRASPREQCLDAITTCREDWIRREENRHAVLGRVTGECNGITLSTGDM